MPEEAAAKAGAATARLPLFQLVVGVSLRLDLRAPPAPPPAQAFDVRELARAEVAATLGASPELDRPLAELDAVAPAGWRCFVAYLDGAPVHRTVVEMRPGRPLAFAVVTEERARGRGAYRATIRFITARLLAEGETTLFASTSLTNRASMRAQRAAGFQVVHHRVDAYVRGTSLRGVARRLLRGA